MIFLPANYREPSPVDVNSMGTRLFTYLIFATGLVIYYLLPILAGVFTDTYSFTPRQVGFLLSADMTANTLSAFSARYWIHRCYWRRVLLFGVVLTVIPNLLCALADGYWGFLSLRCLAGLGVGMTTAFMYATIAASENPDREFACAMAMQVFIGALFLQGAPYLLNARGEGALFIAMALVATLPLLYYRAVPRCNPLTTAQRAGAEAPAPGAGAERALLFGLLAVGVFFASMNSIWSFMERIGDAEGFATEFIATALAVSLLFSFAGALLPAWLAGKVKRIAMIFAGYLLLFIAIFAIGRQPAPGTYLAALCVYNFFYSFVIPFQNGWIASLDESGRSIVLLPVLQGVGIALGPALAGMVIVAEQYAAVTYLSMALLMCSLALFSLVHNQRSGTSS
ncbi:MAG: MFS transporter [Gammaproteobacteria bacterium]|nr:MFS transporter [Gammaproteobacteria bacterium]